MVNNTLEIWYWTFMLVALACIVIYRGICLARHLWALWKNRDTDHSHSS